MCLFPCNLIPYTAACCLHLCACLLLCLYLYGVITNDVKQAYLQEVLKRERKNPWLVCFQSNRHRSSIFHWNHLSRITKNRNQPLAENYFFGWDRLHISSLPRCVHWRWGMGERRPLSVIFLPYSREQKTPSYLPYRGGANNSHQAWWSHFTFASSSDFTATRGCVLVKEIPALFFFCEVTLVLCPITAAQRTRCQRTSGLPRTLQIIWGLQVLIKKVPSCFNTEIGFFFSYVLERFFFMTTANCSYSWGF